MARVTWSQSVWWKKQFCPSCQFNSRDSTFCSRLKPCQSGFPFTALDIEAFDDLHEQLWWPECASLDARCTSCNNQSTTRKSRLHSEASYRCSDMKTSHTFHVPCPLPPLVLENAWTCPKNIEKIIDTSELDVITIVRGDRCVFIRRWCQHFEALLGRGSH